MNSSVTTKKSTVEGGILYLETTAEMTDFSMDIYF